MQTKLLKFRTVHHEEMLQHIVALVKYIRNHLQNRTIIPLTSNKIYGNQQKAEAKIINRNKEVTKATKVEAEMRKQNQRYPCQE